MPFYSPNSMIVLAKTEWNRGEHFKTKQSKSQGKGGNIERVPLIFARN